MHGRPRARSRPRYHESVKPEESPPWRSDRGRRATAPLFAARGAPSSFPAVRGAVLSPLGKIRGNGAPSGAPVFRFAASLFRNAGASRRSMAAFSLRRRAALSAQLLGRAVRLFRRPAPTGRQAFRADHRQRAPRGRPVVATGIAVCIAQTALTCLRVPPAPPECGVTSPARRRRILPRPRLRLMRTPSETGRIDRTTFRSIRCRASDRSLS